MDITILKNHLGDELFAQVSEKLGSVDGLTIINTRDGSWIPKAKFDEERGKVKKLNDDVVSLTADLEAAKQANVDVTSLNQKIEQLTKDVAERDGRINAMRVSGKALEKLRAAKAHNPETVLRLLDMSKISEDKDGNITGVDEQIESLKTSDPYFFHTDNSGRGGFFGGKEPNTGSSGGSGIVPNNDDVNASIRAAAGR